MAPTYSGIGDRCPYELVTGSIARCPRFEARAVFDRSDEAIVTCVHVRCSIARPAPDEGTAAIFYPRCILRTGEIETERTFAVPPD
jgi:hypothetical protein